MKAFRSILILLILALFAAACSGSPDQDATDEPAPSSGLIEGEAFIDSIDVLILESFPVQVNVRLAGNLPDGCTTLGETTINYADNRFDIKIATTRPADAACTEALVPFEQSVALDVLGLSAGDYTVAGGDKTATFNLAIDNVMPDIETPEPLATGKIEGRVWHDLCAILGGDGGGENAPSVGCIDLEGGGYAADGILTPEEPGIEGVEVQLLDGGCNGPVSGTIFTNIDGFFAFDTLTAGTYCVKIDPLANPNSSILIPGGWTSAAEGSAEIDLAEGQIIPALNFGWDYQFLPDPADVEPRDPSPEASETPAANEADCTNSAVFVSETIEDNTVVAAGSNFTKAWTLENNGTCTWTKEYKLVFTAGDAMNGASVNLSKTVKPGESITLEAVLLAPQVGGTYRGDWMLESNTGKRFGLGSNADKTFWVQVKVEGTVSNLNLGTPDWTDSFSSASNWFLVDNDIVRFSVDDGKLRMRAKAPGNPEQWGLANRPAMDDYYLEGVFTTGSSCAGLDRYGILIRAPNPNAGYVFNISCNGQFRIYEWNGSKYNELKAWTSSTAIKTGPEETNRVGVWAEGDTLKLYVNDIVIAELNVDIYDAGQFGLLVGSTNTTNFDVFVDEISYWRLDN